LGGITRMRFKHHRKALIVTAAMGCVAALSMIVALGSHSGERASRFVATQSQRLRACRTLPEVRQVADFTRTFPDGSWVAAVSEHACCSGAGFNATVFYDSSGGIRVDQTHAFCGTEGLQGELNQIAGNSLAAFYAGLHQCQLANLP
jgi:hypothetical protein